MVPLVLSIDDDQSSQILMRAYLKDEEFCDAFVAKANGQEALDYLLHLSTAASAHAWPEVIFLDINMPVLDGWEFLEQFEALCQQYDQYPIIVMVSATNTAEDLAKANANPLVLSLALKPINPHTIEQIRQQASLRHFFSEKIGYARRD